MSLELLSAIEKLRATGPRMTVAVPATTAPAVPPSSTTPPDVEAVVTAFLDELQSHSAFRSPDPRHLAQPNGE
jgi:hypothetical protein